MDKNAATVQKIYEAFGEGDVETVLGAMDDRINWKEPASLPYQDQIGPRAVAENIFGRVLADFEGFAATPNEIIDGSDVVCAIGEYTGTSTATGINLQTDFVHVWRFGPGGKITGFRTYSDTHLWREALGLR